MADSHRRSLQDILGAPSSSRPPPADRPSPSDVTESEDMDYEPTSDDGSEEINNPDYIEALLRGAAGLPENEDEEDDDDDDDNGEEIEGISTSALL